MLHILRVALRTKFLHMARLLLRIARQVRFRRRLSCAIAASALLVSSAAGCAARAKPSTMPALPPGDPVVRVESWQYDGTAATCLCTKHYEIHSTITDMQVLRSLAQVMESAYAQYGEVAPAAPTSPGPMKCYVFASRAQWARYTQHHTGADASVYLQIVRGGYTASDVFVSYYLGEVTTYAIAAHEGWHQYVARHFVGRLPPFLEEGLACMFEGVVRQDGQVHWDLDVNLVRGRNLRNAIELGHTWPLEKLIAMHAGDIVGLPPARIEAFYAQSWAFARFLYEAEHGKYHPALRRMLADAAAGTLYNPDASSHNSRTAWNPAMVRPLLEHYLGTDLERIDRQYQWYIRTLINRTAYGSPRAF